MQSATNLELVILMTDFDLKAKKDVAQIFNNVLRRQIGVRSPTEEYIHSNPKILTVLVKG